jgi:DNA-binding transcriptional MerR regulator
MSSGMENQQYSVGKLAQKYGLSRTALLYYEKIGLLSASGRSPVGYRYYNQNDANRLAQILVFRSMGIALKEIKELLSTTESDITAILIKQLNEINLDIQILRERQGRIINMFHKLTILYRTVTAKNTLEFQNILNQAGIGGPTTALKWHQNFDQASPEEHVRFLKTIGFTMTEIDELVRLVKTAPHDFLSRFFRHR